MKYRVIERFRGKYSIEDMCKVFEVSRSGYYAWRKRQQQAEKDQWLVELVTECQRLCKQTYGIRRVWRWIQRRTRKNVNLKAILRVMRKLNLLSVARRRKTYTRYQRAVHKYSNSRRYALHVCSTGFVRKSCSCVENRHGYVIVSGYRYNQRSFGTRKGH